MLNSKPSDSPSLLFIREFKIGSSIFPMFYREKIFLVYERTWFRTFRKNKTLFSFLFLPTSSKPR
uniref:ASFV_G_ACD_00120 n=1 Tax=African swine fever virus TaxID=10497 RepID=A0A7R8Z1Z0_ASF|nr:ASFV_G_ACD_00120 [African swine fever virus]